MVEARDEHGQIFGDHLAQFYHFKLYFNEIRGCVIVTPFHAFLSIVLCKAITYISRGYHVYTLLALSWPFGHGTLIYIPVFTVQMLRN